jgi:hypothetical protein
MHQVSERFEKRTMYSQSDSHIALRTRRRSCRLRIVERWKEETATDLRGLMGCTKPTLAEWEG